MRSALRRPFVVAACAVVLSVIAIERSLACPLCGIPPETLSQQIAKAQYAAIGYWSGGEESKDINRAGTTDFTLTHILQQSPTEGVAQVSAKIAVGTEITAQNFRAGQPQDQYFLVGTLFPDEQDIRWRCEPISQSAAEYILSLPAPMTVEELRLEFFLANLENPDTTIGNDSFDEFAGASFESICKLKDRLPREKLRTWVASADTTQNRVGLYGLLLGIGGNVEDAPLMESIIRERSMTLAGPALQGLLGGYLMLTNESGLAVVEQQFGLAGKPTQDHAFALMEVLRFAWAYKSTGIAGERLKITMRKLLDQPEFAALAVVDLARWQDWESMDHVVELFSNPDFGDKTTQIAFVQYLQSAERAKGDGDVEPKHVTRAKAHLKQLRRTHAKIVRGAERFQLD